MKVWYRGNLRTVYGTMVQSYTLFLIYHNKWVWVDADECKPFDD